MCEQNPGTTGACPMHLSLSRRYPPYRVLAIYGRRPRRLHWNLPHKSTNALCNVNRAGISSNLLGESVPRFTDSRQKGDIFSACGKARLDDRRSQRHIDVRTCRLSVVPPLGSAGLGGPLWVGASIRPHHLHRHDVGLHQRSVATLFIWVRQLSSASDAIRSRRGQNFQKVHFLLYLQCLWKCCKCWGNVHLPRILLERHKRLRRLPVVRLLRCGVDLVVSSCRYFLR